MNDAAIDFTRWRKLGLVYRHRDLGREWMASQGANPVAGEVDGNQVRVYFNCRDTQSRSYVAWVDVDFSDPLAPVAAKLCDEPVFGPGERGMFDDSGASLGSLVVAEEGTYLYYVGWNLGVTVPWRNSIGLAVRRPGASRFERCSVAPIMDRSPGDPFTLSYPWVLHESDAWHMWYGSHTRWGGPTGFEHVLKYAHSSDGVHWQPQTDHLLQPFSPGEYAFARPCVRREDGRLHMWYCSRGGEYAIFHAWSDDGVVWTRDPAGPLFDSGSEGWDSEMTCYPSVFEFTGGRYMLYNGNAYGRDGFGIAVAHSDGT